MEQCATNVPRMFHNVYQRINAFRLLNKSPWNSDENLIRNEELGVRSYIKLGGRNEELELNWELGVIYIIYVRAHKKEGYTLLIFSVGHY